MRWNFFETVSCTTCTTKFRSPCALQTLETYPRTRCRFLRVKWTRYFYGLQAIFSNVLIYIRIPRIVSESRHSNPCARAEQDDNTLETTAACKRQHPTKTMTTTRNAMTQIRRDGWPLTPAGPRDDRVPVISSGVTIAIIIILLLCTTFPIEMRFKRLNMLLRKSFLVCARRGKS